MLEGDHALVGRMTPRERQCWQLADVEHLSQRQIASRLGISQQAVSKHLRAVDMILNGIRPNKHNGKIQLTPTDPENLDQLSPSQIRAVM
ncbi:MAG: sigma factor-like helix-turn-helix DNA-binding protein [Planctomycetaceae bacterium]